MNYYVYIMASRRNGTLYAGFTSDLVGRTCEHKEGTFGGFSKKYHTHMLVYFEQFGDVMDAITREKRIKKWRRKWKIELIEEFNPHWRDLYYDLL